MIGQVYGWKSQIDKIKIPPKKDKQIDIKK